MPPWHSRLHTASPSSKSTQANKSVNARTPVQDPVSINDFASESLIHGVPFLSLQTSISPQARHHSHHSRSHSHPLPATPGGPNPITDGFDFMNRNDYDDCTIGGRTSAGGSGIRDMYNSPNHVDSSFNVEGDLVTGRCATCCSLVRWPRQLEVFRCTVCLMVNDLKVVQGQVGSYRQSEWQAGIKESSLQPHLTQSGKGETPDSGIKSIS